jgi:hypothetical protein
MLCSCKMATRARCAGALHHSPMLQPSLTVTPRPPRGVQKSYKPNTRYDALLKEYQTEAARSGRGLWSECEPAKAVPSKQVVAAAPLREVPLPAKPRAAKTPPGKAGDVQNPGDTKNCADFGTYAEAKAWFDTYFDLYGDVARLDGNSDGIPCESLLKKEQRPVAVPMARGSKM